MPQAHSSPHSARIAGAVLVALTLTLAGAWYTLTRAPDAIQQTFDAHLQEATSTPFLRPDPPSGAGALEDGAAAAAYEDALRLVRAHPKHQDALYDTVVTLALTLPLQSAQLPAPQLDAAAKPPAPECVALGLPDTPSTLGAQLSPAICQTLATPDIQAALAHINRGCRRRDARGPGLFGATAYNLDEAVGALADLGDVAKLNLIQAHIDAAQGKHRSSVDRALCNIRLGLDITRTHTLIDIMIGASAYRYGLDALRALITHHPDLAQDPELMRYVADMLAWDRLSPDVHARALKGEYLFTMSIGGVTASDPAMMPAHLRNVRTTYPSITSLLAPSLARSMHPYYVRLIQAAALAPEPRHARFEQLHKAATSSIGASVGFEAPDFNGYMTQLDAAIDAHDRTQLMFADLHHRLTHTPQPNLPACHLSGEPYRIVEGERCRALVCDGLSRSVQRALDRHTYANRPNTTCLFPDTQRAAP